MKTITLATASAAVSFRSLLLQPAQTSGAVHKVPLFMDITSQAKVTFRHFNGVQSELLPSRNHGFRCSLARLRRRWLSGYFLVNGGSLPSPRLTDPTCMLFRNNRDGPLPM